MKMVLKVLKLLKQELQLNILKKVIQYSPKVQTAKKVFNVVKDVAPKIQKKLKPSQIKGRTNNPRGTVVSPPKTKPKTPVKPERTKPVEPNPDTTPYRPKTDPNIPQPNTPKPKKPDIEIPIIIPKKPTPTKPTPTKPTPTKPTPTNQKPN